MGSATLLITTTVKAENVLSGSVMIVFAGAGLLVLLLLICTGGCVRREVNVG